MNKLLFQPYSDRKILQERVFFHKENLAKNKQIYSNLRSFTLALSREKPTLGV